MINRREVMASGVAAMLLVRGAVAAASRTGHSADPRFVFIADERIPAARAAALAATASARTANGTDSIQRSFAGDVTPVYDWLDLYLRATPATVAGITTAHALFPIERLAWDRGLRTIYRGVHRGIGGPAPTHELHGSPAIVERIAAVEAADWAARVGRALAEAGPDPAELSRIVTSQQIPADDDALVSWLLAPRATLVTPAAR